MSNSGWFAILIGGLLVNNFVLSQFLGICPFLGVSKKLSQAAGMSAAVIAVMLLATAVTWPIQTFLLDPFDLGYLQTLVFILIIAALVQLVELLLRRFLPPLYKALGIYLPLITTNCAVLSSALLIVQNDYNFLQAVVFGFSAALGFTLAITVFAGVRARMEHADPPRAFKGFPLTLIAAGLLAMAFSCFSGIKL